MTNYEAEALALGPAARRTDEWGTKRQVGRASPMLRAEQLRNTMEHTAGTRRGTRCGTRARQSITINYVYRRNVFYTRPRPPHAPEELCKRLPCYFSGSSLFRGWLPFYANSVEELRATFLVFLEIVNISLLSCGRLVENRSSNVLSPSEQVFGAFLGPPPRFEFRLLMR